MIPYYWLILSFVSGAVLAYFACTKRPEQMCQEDYGRCVQMIISEWGSADARYTEELIMELNNFMANYELTIIDLGDELAAIINKVTNGDGK